MDHPLFQTDSFVPTFPLLAGEQWEVRIQDVGLHDGYWSGTWLTRETAGLARRTDGGWRMWMSMTPLEIESQEIGCRYAVGDTVVMGLGMGWAAANAALRPEVSRVTVIERDPEVIDIVERAGVFAQLPPAIAAKIAVNEGDASEWRSVAPIDTLLADIWLPIFGPGRLEEVRRMCAHTGAARVYFWGQELTIADEVRRLGLPIDGASIARVTAESRLPLIGPGLPDYAERVARAAAAWLN